MKKLTIFASLFLVLALVLGACTPAAEPETVATEPPDAGPPDNANLADFTYVGDPDTVFDLNGWYDEVGVECDVTIRNAGAVKVPDDMTTELP